MGALGCAMAPRGVQQACDLDPEGSRVMGSWGFLDMGSETSIIRMCNCVLIKLDVFFYPEKQCLCSFIAGDRERGGLKGQVGTRDGVPYGVRVFGW